MTKIICLIIILICIIAYGSWMIYNIRAQITMNALFKKPKNKSKKNYLEK